MFSSYTILRPVRDALGITSGLENIPYLFWGVFAVMLLVSLLFMAQVIRWQRRQGARAPPRTAAMPDRVVAPGADGALGSGVFAAFVQVVRSPYLLGIAAFVLLMTWVSTFLYLEQQAFVARAFTSADERTRFFAGIDFYVQAASLTIQFLLFGRLFKWLGMRSLLASVPLLMTAGYALFALTPVFTVLVLVYAVRRVADYAITRPCRDSL